MSKRSLRPDPNFDQLVEKIFPNREEYEAHQESILDSISRSHSQNFITSIKDGIKAQMAHAKAVSKKKNNDDFPESPHHMPITGANRRDEDYEDSPLPPPKNKKKKIKPPTSLKLFNYSGIYKLVLNRCQITCVNILLWSLCWSTCQGKSDMLIHFEDSEPKRQFQSHP